MSHAPTPRNHPPVTTDATGTVVLKRQTWLNVVFFTLLPPLGAGLGWLLSLVPGWLTLLPAWIDGLPMIPGHEQFALLDGLSGPWLTGVLIALGAVAGVALAVMTLSTPVWEINRERLRITRDKDMLLDVRLHHVRSLHPDGGDVVVLGPRTEVIFRGEVEPSQGDLEAAAAHFGLAWHAADPFDADYVRWLDGDPELTDRVNALLRTRAQAVEGEDEEDRTSLSESLQEEGIVVRDIGKRQYWRKTEM